ncbi:hypothetical protein CDL15_Pgr012829 [Punica granatum]|nr:hypothetical protein CDL15_Pgr012829 [Punica granatum]PKI66396.1 hypothetical protein CRG98_013198 [Punica granatum]
MEKKAPLLAILMIFLLVTIMRAEASCPSYGSECSGCITERMKYGCPRCRPLLKCMARCLWGGRSRALCTKRCDCNSSKGKPRLSDCKKCMSKCRCSCMS